MTKEQAIKLDIPPTDVICVRSVCRSAQGKLLVGLKTADIIEVDQNSCKSLIFGHGEGQLWALSPHPTEMIFATGSYDRNLVVWDISERVKSSTRLSLTHFCSSFLIIERCKSDRPLRVIRSTFGA